MSRSDGLPGRLGTVVARGAAVVRRAARQGRQLADHFRVVTIRHGEAAGMRIGMRYASNDYHDGSVELPVQREIARLAGAGGVFYDIGANVGFFSLVAGRAGATGVYAFEPRADIARALRRNLARNDLPASVLEVAVGDADTDVDLYVARHPGGATTAADRTYDVTGLERVRQVRIDDLVASGEVPPPDLVKLDVEGSEPAVLRGMLATLQRWRPALVFEIDAPDAARAGEQYAEVEQILAAAGYGCRRLESSYPDAGWAVLHAVATASGPPQP